MQGKLESVYLLDDDKYLHLKEIDKGIKYMLFDKTKREKINDGLVSRAVLEDCPFLNELEAARQCVIDELGIDVNRVAKVSLTTLEHFKDSDIRRRKIWEPESLPEDDIRFINSHYEDLFRIPNGGSIEIQFPNQKTIKHCQFIDEYHTQVGDEVFHICQFAEQMERLNANYAPESEPTEDQLAWKVGKNHFFVIQSCDDGWDYTIYDKNFNEFDGGQFDMPELSILEARDEILTDYEMNHCDLIVEDYEDILDRVELVENERSNIILANREAFSLACSLAQFSSDFDLYDFNDSVNDIDFSISSLKKQILLGDTKKIKDFMQMIIDDNSEYKDLASAYVHHLDEFPKKYPQIKKNDSVLDKLHNQKIEVSDKCNQHKTKEIER